MNDLSSPSNPVVIIAILITMCVAGVQANRHKEHFVPKDEAHVVSPWQID